MYPYLIRLKKKVWNTVDYLINYSEASLQALKNDNDACENRWVYILGAAYGKVEYPNIKCIQNLGLNAKHHAAVPWWFWIKGRIPTEL